MCYSLSLCYYFYWQEHHFLICLYNLGCYVWHHNLKNFIWQFIFNNICATTSERLRFFRSISENKICSSTSLTYQAYKCMWLCFNIKHWYRFRTIFWNYRIYNFTSGISSNHDFCFLMQIVIYTTWRLIFYRNISIYRSGV